MELDLQIAIEDTPEYILAEKDLTPTISRRSQQSHFIHVRQGIEILRAMKSSYAAQRAFAIHPLLQDKEKLDFYRFRMENCSVHAVVLAMEFCALATAGKRPHNPLGKTWMPAVSNVHEVNDMLIADKIQNWVSYKKYHNLYPDLDKKQMIAYFNKWFDALGVTQPMVDIIADGANLGTELTRLEGV